MSDLLKLENQLCHRFYLLSNAFTRAYRPLLERLDITYPQYVTLMALWEQDGITVAELLLKTGIDGGAMSLILKKLQQKAFLNVIKDENDKRIKRISLTEKGRSSKEEATSIPAQMLCKLEGMSVAEGRELITLLDKLQGCFKNEFS